MVQAMSPEGISSTFYKQDWYIKMCGNVTTMKRTGKRRNKNEQNGRKESSMNEGRADRCVFDFFPQGKKGGGEVGTPSYRYLFDADPIYIDVEGGWATTTPLPNDFSAYSCNWPMNPKFGFATLLLLLI